MLRIKKGSSLEIPKIAELHWKRYEQHFKKRIDTVNTLKSVKYKLEQEVPEFYSWLNQEENLKRLIVGKPSVLNDCLKEIQDDTEFKSKWNVNLYKQGDPKFKPKAARIRQMLNCVLSAFPYEHWRDYKGKDEYDSRGEMKDEFLSTKEWATKHLDTPVCCYCNRQYTTPTQWMDNKGQDDVIRLFYEWDHWF